MAALPIPLPGTAGSWDPINIDDVSRLRDAGLLPKYVKDAVRVWDKFYSPMTDLIMPPTPSPGGGKRTWSWSVMADSGMMAPRSEGRGEPEMYSAVVKEEQFYGGMIQSGYEMEPVIGGEEFPRNEQIKVEQCTAMLNRREEFDCLRYAAMDNALITEFSTQRPLSRGLAIDITLGTPAGIGLMGAPWDDYFALGAAFLSNPILDIDRCALTVSQMAHMPARYLFVGPNTWAALIDHPVITTFLQWNSGSDLVRIGADVATIHGIEVHKVENFYKEQNGANLLRAAPGRGDWEEDTWANRNTVEFMRDFATGTNTEFALMTTGPVGGRFYYPVHQRHGNGASPFVWSDEGFDLVKKVGMRKGYGMFVEDFARVRRLDQVATIMV